MAFQGRAGQGRAHSEALFQKINDVSVKKNTGCIELIAGPVGTQVQLDLFSPTDNKVTAMRLARRKFLTVTGRKQDH